MEQNCSSFWPNPQPILQPSLPYWSSIKSQDFACNHHIYILIIFVCNDIMGGCINFWEDIELLNCEETEQFHLSGRWWLRLHAYSNPIEQLPWFLFPCNSVLRCNHIACMDTGRSVDALPTDDIRWQMPLKLLHYIYVEQTEFNNVNVCLDKIV